MLGRSLFKKRDDKLANKHRQEAEKSETPDVRPSQAQGTVPANPSQQETGPGKSPALSPKRGPNKQTPKAKSSDVPQGRSVTAWALGDSF